ncbi:FAD-dependent oxidoreductase [Sedimentibacter hydroxybenzoicus DSM 7310]|uniref:Urocanate reductase n=1 Tax=Sedimentibacter hydroxybenzoicus DSM 7310 TaxID=1123245 RepID=A0A974GWQ1_SEDHY|nr:FAD-dependent oxidoreductase [Sedimentibacter hydroxybenzoicus]NYB74693.1 FAD-dependent oxidoreductase [Sedimentibacter hydroxybenzoicus DSM 7310]
MKNLKCKRLIAFLLSVSMMLSMLGCSKSETGVQSPQEEGQSLGKEGTQSLKDGTYVVKAKGHNGEMEVEVIFENGNIKDISLINHVETTVIGEGAFNAIKPVIIENQTLNVDLVAGATVSSAAILNAVSLAIEEAGGIPSDFKVNAVEKRTAKSEEITTDVVAIGAGVAGLATAIEAVDGGLNVIVLEKNGVIGGTTARSEGIIQAAGTQLQLDMGIEDTAESMFEGMKEVIGDTAEVDFDFVKMTTDQSAGHIQWLIDKGVPFQKEVKAVHIYEPRSIPREHFAEEKGSGLIENMAKYAEENGAKILLDTAATEIIKDGNKVVGVKATNKYGDDITIYAKAVVLAAGGYTGNKDLMKKLNPNVVDFVSGGMNQGDGYLLAESMGGDMIVRPDALYHFMYLLPTSIVNPGAIGFFTPELLLVAPDGNRYADEASYTFDRTNTIIDKGYDHVYAVVNQEFYEKHKEAVDEGIKFERAFKGETVQELAENMGLDSVALAKTVERYNELCDKKIDEDFNKPAEYLQKIEGPYYGLMLTSSIAETFNGVRINEYAQVIGTDGNVIEGFYAAGSCAMAQMTSQRYFGSGTAILNAITFAREASNHIISTLNR